MNARVLCRNPIKIVLIKCQKRSCASDSTSGGRSHVWRRQPERGAITRALARQAAVSAGCTKSTCQCPSATTIGQRDRIRLVLDDHSRISGLARPVPHVTRVVWKRRVHLPPEPVAWPTRFWNRQSRHPHKVPKPQSTPAITFFAATTTRPALAASGWSRLCSSEVRCSSKVPVRTASSVDPPAPIAFLRPASVRLRLGHHGPLDATHRGTIVTLPTTEDLRLSLTEGTSRCQPNHQGCQAVSRRRGGGL